MRYDQVGGVRGGTKWGPLLGASADVNELAGQLRAWLDEAGLTLNDLVEAFTEDHFGGLRPPGRTAIADRLAGKRLDLVFAEAVVDVCSERHADAAPKLVVVRRMWERVERAEALASATSPAGAPESAPAPGVEAAGLQALVDSQRETIEVHRQLAKALEALAHSERVQADSEKLVIVLVQMINQLTSRIRTLRRDESAQVEDPGAVRGRLAEAETLLSQALLEKQAAEAQWQEALALADAAQRQVLVLQRELRQARGEDVEEPAPGVGHSMPSLAGDGVDEDPEFLADIEQALTKAHSVNQDNQALTEQAREDLARIAEDDGQWGGRREGRGGDVGGRDVGGRDVGGSDVGGSDVGGARLQPQGEASGRPERHEEARDRRRSGSADGEPDTAPATPPRAARAPVGARQRAVIAIPLTVAFVALFLMAVAYQQGLWSLVAINAAILTAAGSWIAASGYFARARPVPIAQTESPSDRSLALLGSHQRLLAETSHELRTPLTALSMRLEEIITLAEDPATVRDEADIALSMVERLSNMVQLKLRSGPAGMSVPVDVDSVIRQQVHEWRPVYQASRRGIVVSGERRTTVRTAPGVVSQILSILLDNALAHGEGTVTVHTRHVGDTVVMEVNDEGPGVTDEQAEKIFQRSRGQARGLPIARELAESYGGRLSLALQRPAVFALFLPRDTTSD